VSPCVLRYRCRRVNISSLDIGGVFLYCVSLLTASSVVCD